MDKEFSKVVIFRKQESLIDESCLDETSQLLAKAIMDFQVQYCIDNNINVRTIITSPYE